MVIEQAYKVNGVGINTLTTGNGKKAIVFIHGNSSWAKTWMPQLNSAALVSSFRLIAVDMPGHGKSDRLQSYSLQLLAEVLNGLLPQLLVEEYIVVAISLGTAYAGEAAHLLKGCKGFFIVSSNLTSNEYNPGVYMIPFAQVMALMSASATDEEIKALAQHLVVDKNSPVVNDYVSSYKQTDPAFRVSLGQIITTGAWTEELANLHKAALPVALVFGEEEKAINTSYLDKLEGKWRNRVFHVKGAGHFVNGEQPEAFNKLLLDFAAETLK